MEPKKIDKFHEPSGAPTALPAVPAVPCGIPRKPGPRAPAEFRRSSSWFQPRGAMRNTETLDFAPVPSCALSHRIFGGHQLKYFMINTSNSKAQGMVKSYTCFGKLRFGKCEFWIILGRWKHGLERLQPFWKHWILECEAMNIQGLNQVYLTARSCRIGYMLSVTKCPSASWPLPGRNLRDQWTDKTSSCRWCWF